MTRFDAIEVERTEDFFCEFCDCDADYIITVNNREFYICKKCLGVINHKAALIDANEAI